VQILTLLFYRFDDLGTSAQRPEVCNRTRCDYCYELCPCSSQGEFGYPLNFAMSSVPVHLEVSSGIL
jgi:hypothetical protein